MRTLTISLIGLSLALGSATLAPCDDDKDKYKEDTKIKAKGDKYKEKSTVETKDADNDYKEKTAVKSKKGKTKVKVERKGKKADEPQP